MAPIMYTLIFMVTFTNHSNLKPRGRGVKCAGLGIQEWEETAVTGYQDGRLFSVGVLAVNSRSVFRLRSR
jgi:hypothetical protein